MSGIARFFVQPLTIITPGERTDRYGATTPDWTDTTDTDVLGWVARLTEDEDHTDARDALVSGWALRLPHDTAITGRDRVVWDGQTFELDAPPNKARDGSGRVDHIRARLRLVEG